MPPRVSPQLLAEFSDFVAKHTGLSFRPDRWPDLERGIHAALEQFHSPDAESCVRWLLSAPLAPAQIEILASALTVGETYFFRDKPSFELLAQRVLPDWIQRRSEQIRRLRIWSAGCSTGEEAYSLAILLDRNLPDLRQWQITILASDINARSLQKAARGVFGEWSFRDAPPWLKAAYFTQVGPHEYEVVPRIKDLVEFNYLNLAEDSFPSLSNHTNAMDLILCRNVLMYFTDDRARKVVRNFERALADSGCLMVSAVEASAELFSQFFAEQPAGAVLYRKLPPDFSSSPPAPRIELPSPPVGSDAAFPASALLQAQAPPPQRNHAASPLAKPTSDALQAAVVDGAISGQGLDSQAADGLAATGKTSAFALDRAQACANSGQLDAAAQWADTAIAADKLNPELHFLRAMIAQEQGLADQAAASLQHALYLDPDFVLAHYALGNHNLQRRKFKQADKHFTNALALLAGYQQDAVLPHSDGLAAGRLRELIESTRIVEQTS